MKLYFGARVFSSDNHEIGILTEVVLNPATREVTHLVIQKGLLFHNDALVPAAGVVEATRSEVHLCLRAAEMESCSGEFRQEEFLPAAEVPAAIPGEELKGALWTPPVGPSPLPKLPQSLVPPGITPGEISPHVSVPPEEIVLDPGCPVESCDGKTVGHVQELVLDANQQITHLLVITGHMLKDPKLVPVHWISRIDNNQVFLAVTARQIDRLAIAERQ